MNTPAADLIATVPRFRFSICLPGVVMTACALPVWAMSASRTDETDAFKGVIWFPLRNDVVVFGCAIGMYRVSPPAGCPIYLTNINTIPEQLQRKHLRLSC